MRKVWLIILFNLVVLATAFAQKTDSITTKLQKHKGVKTQMVNGSAMASNQNIIQNVAKAKNYSVLLSAINAAGFTQTFESRGPLTIFAPTNTAFAKLPAGKMDTLMMPTHKWELSSLVAYHAIPGKLSVKNIARDIRNHKGTANYITLAGTKLIATIDANNNILLTDETGGQCTISQVDVVQSNGILHVVNGVIVPKKRVI
jgi:uncharacterized surface protein with fasciclin (FAS1) repeats